MACNPCELKNLRNFRSEIAVHYPLTKEANTLPTLVFTEIAVCLTCGRAEFTVPKTQLAALAKSV